MSEVTLAELAISSEHAKKPRPAVFSAESGDARLERWGPVFSVFGDDLDAVLASAAHVTADVEGLTEEVHAAARRYGALLEVMCNSADGGGRPSTVYDCCDGISVLLLSQRPASAKVVEDALSVFEAQKTAIDEGVFMAFLAKAMQEFFAKNVPDPAGIVTVTVGVGDYCFMRAQERNTILQKLQIASSAHAY